jgi:DNA-binding NarL/FixJ family response regulator
VDKIRIVIVDDSPFSIALLRGTLEDEGYEVVGEAGNLQEVKEVVADKKPNLVTMDMTLPGTDGLECTRAIHEIDKSIKVIVISAMMDDEIVKKAKQSKVSGYIQKPVDADELKTAIERVMSSEELYQLLQQEYFEVFKEGLMDGVNRMTKTLITYKEEYLCKTEQESSGMTVIIGIIGKFSGRLLLDLSMETANHLATALLRKEPKDNNEIIAALGEFANIVTGNACSILNRKNKAFGFRIAPPSILHGEAVHISVPDFETMCIHADADYGEILLNVGFKRGDDNWM